MKLADAVQLHQVLWECKYYNKSEVRERRTRTHASEHARPRAPRAQSAFHSL